MGRKLLLSFLILILTNFAYSEEWITFTKANGQICTGPVLKETGSHLTVGMYMKGKQVGQTTYDKRDIFKKRKATKKEKTEWGWIEEKKTGQNDLSHKEKVLKLLAEIVEIENKRKKDTISDFTKKRSKNATRSLA